MLKSCPGCAKKLGKMAEFCPSCGTSISPTKNLDSAEKAEKIEMEKSCFKEINHRIARKLGANYCLYCGRDLRRVL